MSAKAFVSNKHYSFKEYLQLEEQYGVKMDYGPEDCFPKAESALNHADIAFNITKYINAHFRPLGGRCFQQSVQVDTGNNAGFIVPDVVLTCSEKDINASAFISEPLLIAEVLSTDTSTYDWETKWPSYLSLLSLKYIVFVYQQRLWVDLYTRIEESRVFQLQDFDKLSDIIQFSDTQYSLSLAQIYEYISFPDKPLNTTGILWFDEP